MGTTVPCQGQASPTSGETRGSEGASPTSLAWRCSQAGCLQEVGRDPGHVAGAWRRLCPLGASPGPAGARHCPLALSPRVRRVGGSLSRAGWHCGVEMEVSKLLPPSGSPGPWLTAGSSRIPWVVLKNSGTGSPRLGPCQGLSPRQACGRGPSVCLWVLGAHGASAP